MRNLTLFLSYLGTPFFGWQKTASGPTIEETLENALCRILRETPKLQAASRTDAGVHAEGQVVNFFTTNPICLSTLKRALNGTLPKEISVRAIEEKPLAFHPTLDALKKEYHYQICHAAVQLPFHRYTCWHFPYALNRQEMQTAAQLLLGTHDFSAFCNERASWDRQSICHLEEISFHDLSEERICIRVLGDHFLYKMVRNLVGTLVYVGVGKIQAEEIPSILQSKDRSRAGMTAPAHGLCLYQVYYLQESNI